MNITQNYFDTDPEPAFNFANDPAPDPTTGSEKSLNLCFLITYKSEKNTPKNCTTPRMEVYVKVQKQTDFFRSVYILYAFGWFL
jgi:hypothetical protein